MTTYSIRCRNSACRHRRVSSTHPDDYRAVPRCPVCGQRKGWRIESRAFRRNQVRCWCDGPTMAFGRHFPHRPTHPLCDQHPHGFYNQARARGVAHEDIPEEYRPMSPEKVQLLIIQEEIRQMDPDDRETIEAAAAEIRAIAAKYSDGHGTIAAALVVAELAAEA